MLETGKIKLFTHSDLDGVSCGIILETFLVNTDAEIEIEYCSNPKKASEKVKEFWESLDIVGEHGYTKMFITDISINDEVAEMINETSKHLIGHPKVALIDHHESAKHLNKYDWSFVMPELDDVRESGTSLFLKVLCGMYDIELQDDCALVRYAEIVRRYDSWGWTTKYNDKVPKQYNDLLWLMGRERFVANVKFKIFDNSLALEIEEETMLEIEQERNQKYIYRKIESMQKMIIEGYNAGVVVAERCVSDLGNQMCKLNPDIDIAVIIGSNAVSFRAIKDDIDVSKLAKMYGGGGHPKASGAPLPDDMLQSMVKLIFN